MNNKMSKECILEARKNANKANDIYSLLKPLINVIAIKLNVSMNEESSKEAYKAVLRAVRCDKYHNCFEVYAYKCIEDALKRYRRRSILMKYNKDL